MSLRSGASAEDTRVERNVLRVCGWGKRAMVRERLETFAARASEFALKASVLSEVPGNLHRFAPSAKLVGKAAALLAEERDRRRWSDGQRREPPAVGHEGDGQRLWSIALYLVLR
jgi:hypothetical protein